MNITLITHLIGKGYIQKSQLAYILFIQSVYKTNFEELLVNEGFITDNKLALLIAEISNFYVTQDKLQSPKILNIENFDNYIRYGYCLCAEDQEHIIVCRSINLYLIQHLAQNYQGKFTKIKIEEKFDELFIKLTQKYNLLKACIQFDYINPLGSVRRIPIISLLLKAFVIFTLLFIVNKKLFLTFLYTISIIFSLFKLYLYVIRYFQPTSLTMQEKEVEIQDSEYPVYSLLIPLYKEPSKVPAILQAIERVDYPKDKLDVKILLEADDIITINALAVNSLPNYIHIIKVPVKLPRTKPKALNYGLQYITGKYVGVYDAEDIPDKMQLKKVCKRFDTLPDDYVCVQAKLNFYNKEENLLTKFFSIEYYIWFNFILEGLDQANLPITLGGTSNHFKAETLKQLGGWDPYNVTEDADLGIRIYNAGFKTKILNSETLEESVINLKAWIYQRARWIKGFIKTYFVYARQRKHKNNNLSFFSSITIDIFLGLSVLNFAIFPILYLVEFLVTYNNILLYYRSFSLALYLIHCYLAAVMAMKYFRKSFLRFTIQDIFVIISWPLYFVLHSFAAWRAIYELFIKPYEWNKTEHGTSSLEIKLDDRFI